MGSSPPTPATRATGPATVDRTGPIKIFFDGGARPNPGPIEVAVVVRGQTRFADDLGSGGNGDAEWHAANAALAVARSLLGDVVLLGDSEHALARARRDPAFAGVRLRKVKRSQNLAGIALAARHRAGCAPPARNDRPARP